MKRGMQRKQQSTEACHSVERIRNTYADLAEHYRRNHETVVEFEGQRIGEHTQFAYHKIVHHKEVVLK